MNDLEISNVATLPLKLQLKELGILKRNHIAQTNNKYNSECIRILQALQARAMLNPNYIKHEITDGDIKILLTSIVNELALLTKETYQTASAQKIINNIWAGLEVSKHSDWLKKVKNDNRGYLFKRIISNNFGTKLPSILTVTYEKLDLNKIDFNKSLNHISKQIFNEVREVMVIEFLKEEVSSLRQQSIIDKVTILNLQKDIKTGRLVASETDWKCQAVEMRAQGYSVGDIIKKVGKKRTAVSNALNTPKAKAALNKQ
jgi:hypothetical protein